MSFQVATFSPRDAREEDPASAFLFVVVCLSLSLLLLFVVVVVVGLLTSFGDATH